LWISPCRNANRSAAGSSTPPAIACTTSARSAAVPSGEEGQVFDRQLHPEQGRHPQGGGGPVGQEPKAAGDFRGQRHRLDRPAVDQVGGAGGYANPVFARQGVDEFAEVERIARGLCGLRA
jgi:hypothetical protein